MKLFIILDKSGSMASVEQATVSGLNEYLGDLRKEKNKYEVSLTLFDHHVKTLFTGKNLKEVADLTREDYSPSGMTALYDAVGEVVTLAKKSVKKADKALVCIMTDGGENSSQEFDQAKITKLIQDLEKSGNWTFTFLGANQDSWAAAQKMGFVNQGNVANYKSTDLGTAQAFAAMSMNTSNLASSRSANATSFYSADKDKLDG